MVVYLRTTVPTIDSSLFIVILKIQLKLIYWATTPPVIIILLTILYLYTWPINKSTVVFPTRLCYIITTIVIVKEVKQYATKSTSYNAINGSNNLRNK